MTRQMLTDEQWERIAQLLPPPRGRGRPYEGDHRSTIEGILWIARTGAPWRDLPERYGKWITVYQRFRRWTRRGVFDAVFASLACELDLGIAMVDGTFVKVHQHAAGAPKEEALPCDPALTRQLGSAEEGPLPRLSRSPIPTGRSHDSPSSRAMRQR